MIIDKEDMQQVEQYISDDNIIQLINNLKIHEVFKNAYQELGTNDQYLFLYYALIKSGMFEEFDASNYGFKVEKFGGAQIKVTMDHLVVIIQILKRVYLLQKTHLML